MSSIRNEEPIRVGMLTDEPLRLAGLATIFEASHREGYASLSPVKGNLEELLSDATVAYLLLDLNSSSGGVGTLEAIRRRRPDIRLIVIGPEGGDKLILDLIVAGARAYLDLNAGPEIVREALAVVTSGSIWAPRRLLSELIDQLLGASDSSHTHAPLHLTKRERQVLELIFTARSNREIAHELGIEESTVQAHVGRLMRKTGADNRIDLLMLTSDPALLHAAGIADRRQVDRRERDRRLASSKSLHPITHK
ncbi:MAG: response regulator transcription factor [Terracidiphilus sp.]